LLVFLMAFPGLSNMSLIVGPYFQEVELSVDMRVRDSNIPG